MLYNKNKTKTFEEKRITNYFMIEKDKYRLCYTPKGNPKNLSIQLNYHITCFGPVLKKIINLMKYDVIKIYTKSEFVDEKDERNVEMISDIVVNEYSYRIFDLNLIRSSQEESYSLFCILETKKLK